MEDDYVPEDIMYCRRCDYFQPTDIKTLSSGLEKHTCLVCHTRVYYPAPGLKSVPEVYDRVRRIETPISEDEFLGSIGKGWKKHAKGYILEATL